MLGRPGVIASRRPVVPTNRRQLDAEYDAPKHTNPPDGMRRRWAGADPALFRRVGQPSAAAVPTSLLCLLVMIVAGPNRRPATMDGTVDVVHSRGVGLGCAREDDQLVAVHPLRGRDGSRSPGDLRHSQPGLTGAAGRPSGFVVRDRVASKAPGRVGQPGRPKLWMGMTSILTIRTKSPNVGALITLPLPT